MLKELLETKGVLFGSRALGVHQDTSDYDYAILEKDVLENQTLFRGLRLGDPERYLQNSPETPVAIFFKAKINETESSDILVLTDEDDLQVVSDAVSDLQQVPTYMLTEKNNRIRLYQQALRHYGWNTRRPGLISSLPAPGRHFGAVQSAAPTDTSTPVSTHPTGLDMGIIRGRSRVFPTADNPYAFSDEQAEELRHRYLGQQAERQRRIQEEMVINPLRRHLEPEDFSFFDS